MNVLAPLVAALLAVAAPLAPLLVPSPSPDVTSNVEDASAEFVAGTLRVVLDNRGDAIQAFVRVEDSRGVPLFADLVTLEPHKRATLEWSGIPVGRYSASFQHVLVSGESSVDLGACADRVGEIHFTSTFGGLLGVTQQSLGVGHACPVETDEEAPNGAGTAERVQVPLDLF